MSAPALLVRGGDVLDVDSGSYLEGADVLAVDGRVVEVGRALRTGLETHVVDATGRRVLPGLVDCHVHVTAATADIAAMTSWPTTYVTAHTAVRMRQMLERGFTTVRDVGGADHGLARAQEEGLIVGPRLAFGGKALSQTGGHGDLRSAGQQVAEDPDRCFGLTRVVDGVDALRVAARDELRRGAHHLKVLTGGGISSPTDRIDSVQYSAEELRAVVEVAEAAHRYVTAHAYTSESVRHALRAGVRCIEHGNLIDGRTVELLVECGAFLVPTLVTYWASQEEGREFGLPEASHRKVAQVMDAGLGSLEAAHRAGVRIAHGSDLMGGMQRHQSEEFRIRAGVLPALDVIRSATTVAAELLGMVGEVGTLVPGAHADLVLVVGDPLEDVALLAAPERSVPVVVQGGQLVVDRR